MLTGLPKLRSALSKTRDNGENWKASVKKIFLKGVLTGIDKEVKQEIVKQLDKPFHKKHQVESTSRTQKSESDTARTGIWIKSLMEFVIMLPEETWRVICSGIFLWPALPE